MRNTPIWNCPAALLILVCIAGCETSEFAPVEGIVTLKGKPLANAVVMLAPVRGNGPGPFVGTTDNDGHYTLGPKDNPGAGAVVGDYSIVIATVISDPDENAPVKVQKEVVPDRFRNGSQKFTVPEGGATEANFAM